MKENDEEFNNFMVRVNEISKIVGNLTSADQKQGEVGIRQADDFLKYTDIDSMKLDDELIITKTKFNKTFINKITAEEGNPGEMSQATFKREIEQDIDKRAKDRSKRKEQSDTLKRRGNNAFRQSDFVKALSCYNDAINYTRDSPLLYLNKALTYLNLHLYEQCVADCKLALKLDEDSMKAWLYLIKCYMYLKDDKKFRNAVKEVKKAHPDQGNYINDYIDEVRRNFEEIDNEESFEFM